MPDLRLDANKRQAIRVAAVVLMVLASVLLVFDCVRNAMAQEGRLAELNSELAEVMSELDLVNQDSGETVEHASGKLASAKKDGEAVASLQNDFTEIVAGGDGDISATAEALAKLFADGADASAGRVPWTPGMTEEGTWRFATSLSTTSGTIPSLWLFEVKGGADAGRVMMYAVADYDVESGTFSSLEKHTTGFGATRIDTTGSQPDAQPTAEPYDEGAGDGDADVDQDAIDAALADVAGTELGEE